MYFIGQHKKVLYSGVGYSATFSLLLNFKAKYINHLINQPSIQKLTFNLIFKLITSVNKFWTVLKWFKIRISIFQFLTTKILKDLSPFKSPLVNEDQRCGRVATQSHYYSPSKLIYENSFWYYIGTFIGGSEYIKELKKRCRFIVMVLYRCRFFMWQPLKPKQPPKPKLYKVKTEGYKGSVFYPQYMRSSEVTKTESP